MAIAYGSGGTVLNQSSAATSWAVPYPASIAAGDLLVLHVVTGGGVLSATPPTGWTEVYRETVVANPKGGIYIKVAAGTESGTLTVTTASTTGAAQIHRYTGVDTTTPQDAASTVVSLDASTDATIDLPALTTVTANAWLVYANGSNSGTVTHTSAGATERSELAGSRTGALYDLAVVTPAATARTITQSTARAYWGAMLALRPAGGGGGSPQTVNPSAVSLSATEGTPTLSTAVVVAPGGKAVTVTEGTPQISVGGSPQTVNPSAVSLLATEGTPTLTMQLRFNHRQSGAWVTRHATPKVYVSGAWVVAKRPRYWNGTAWVYLT